MNFNVPVVNITPGPEWSKTRSDLMITIKDLKEQHKEDYRLNDNLISDYQYNFKNNVEPQYKDIVYEEILTGIIWTSRYFDLDYRRLKIKDIWFQEAEKGAAHGVHTHGVLGFSGVLFVQYDSEAHEPTRFISPFTHPINGTHYDEQPGVEEGSVLIFPSYLLHEQPVNKSSKPRTVISFNLEYQE